jgi:hypothetical protein
LAGHIRVARWEIRQSEQRIWWSKKRLEEAQRSIGMHEKFRQEDLPLWELKYVHEGLLDERRTLEKWKREVPNTGRFPCSEAEIQEGIRSTEKRVAIREKAYAASVADAERLCPGRAPFPVVDEGQVSQREQLVSKVKEWEATIEMDELDAEDIRKWMAQLPDSAVEARRLAQLDLDRVAKRQEDYREMRGACLARLEELANQAQANAGGHS